MLSVQKPHGHAAETRPLDCDIQVRVGHPLGDEAAAQKTLQGVVAPSVLFIKGTWPIWKFTENSHRPGVGLYTQTDSLINQKPALLFLFAFVFASIGLGSPDSESEPESETDFA